MARQARHQQADPILVINARYGPTQTNGSCRCCMVGHDAILRRSIPCWDRCRTRDEVKGDTFGDGVWSMRLHWIGESHNDMASLVSCVSCSNSTCMYQVTTDARIQPQKQEQLGCRKAAILARPRRSPWVRSTCAMFRVSMAPVRMSIKTQEDFSAAAAAAPFLAPPFLAPPFLAPAAFLGAASALALPFPADAFPDLLGMSVCVCVCVGVCED